MATHTYPRDLYPILQERWQQTRGAHGSALNDLPEEAVLHELLEVCYHASLMAEEGRPIIFRVAFIPRSEPVSFPRLDGPDLDAVWRYMLGTPVPFTESELRRLAPVADPRRVIIAVEQTGEGAQKRLQVYGLVDVGMALWEMARHERVMGTCSPNALVVASTHPGELSISRGDGPLIRLRGGKLFTPLPSVLYRGPVSQFFCGATEELIASAIHRSGVQREEQDDGLDFAHLAFIESVLLYTAELHHGGALLFVPDATKDDDARLCENVSIKYRLPSTRPQDALLTAMAIRLQHNTTQGRLQEDGADQEELQELEALDQSQRSHEDYARDAARFIASLTAVDGAVVLTDKLRVIGFGAEVRVREQGADTIHHATNEQGTETKSAPFTGYGTRHRSAFRFVESMHPAVAFILSQDGGIKAATMVGDRVVMWTDFEVGYTTALS